MIHWLLDFDDTLVTGPITWGLEHVVPAMIAQHHLPYDETVFTQALLKAQRQTNENHDEQRILDELFETLGWPATLQQQFMYDIYNGYRLALFEDAMPFLERLAAAGHRMTIISNNNHAPEMAEQLGIAHFFTGIYTPQRCDGVAAKPARDMWDYVMGQEEKEQGSTAAMVGDDPWSDGTFAEEIGITCWLLDRMGRYATVYANKPYRWVRSLRDIVLPD